ncbi:MAG: hypothetical protein Q8O29_11520 [Polaromonas sp.]|uniref:hypothetical protein n=1 Tax=Polaromonas sp. TaxID=1869339 RepID=UPI0027362B57|nr:hypothetical protein [Polaromonas sp.]MDP2818879.1 hypothetical protein [Polaromonas sp.]
MSLVRNFHQVRIGGRILAVALGLVATPLAALAQTSAEATATRSSSDRGVTVKVTPKLVGSPGSRWEFGIVLETHSTDLSDDLTQIATLTTNDGRILRPTAWVGAGPTGHHREGVLAFEVPPPRPSAVELKIARPGESEPRIFRWQL